MANLLAHVRLLHAALPHLLGAEGDRAIVNVGSTLAHKLVPGSPPTRPPRAAWSRSPKRARGRVRAGRHPRQRGHARGRGHAAGPRRPPGLRRAQGDMARAYPLAGSARPRTSRRRSPISPPRGRAGSRARSSTSTAASASHDPGERLALNQSHKGGAMRAPFVVAVAVVAGLAGLGAGQLDELGATARQDDSAVDLAESQAGGSQPQLQLEARSTGRRPRSSS